MDTALYPKLLVVSIPGDFHSAAVSWCLRKLGVYHEVIIPGDIPDYSKITLNISHGNCEGLIKRSDGSLVSTRDVKAVWMRRVGYPPAPQRCHEGDVEVVESSYRFHIDNLIAILSDQAIIVNSGATQHRANKKALQLVVASRVGFTIPRTCISNAFEQVLDFCKCNDATVFKMFYMRSWRADGQLLGAFTAEVGDLQEEDRDGIELCPNIFQQKITYVSEIRLVVFGKYFYGLEMRKLEGDPSGLSDIIDDSRLLLNYGRLSFRPATVPKDVIDKVRSYMSHFGLEYGAFDFLVSHRGDWTFLECNEAGQFLFLEEYLPEIGLLNRFARWLADLADLSPAESSMRPTLAEFNLSAEVERVANEPFEHNNFLAYRPIIDED